MDKEKTETDDPFWDALARWEELYQRGQDLAPEDLCRDHPENLDKLKQHIHAMKRTAWLTKPVADDPAAAQPVDTSDHTPKHLGEYDILEKIATGGMGQVFKARHRRMDRVVAIKLLPRVSAESAQRFQDEVRAAAKMSHPNIVTSFDAGEQDGVPFLVMEFIEGTDLAQHLQQHGPMPVEKAVKFTLQAAKGLEYAHGKGVVHRDIKPGNLILGGDGTVKVLDLGLAQRHTKVGTVFGTTEFLAPEVIETGNADHCSDIYSLGCTLYFLLTGKSPFTGRTVIQTVIAHREQPIPSLRAARPDVPASLDAVFQKMVAKQPQARHQSMGEVIAALETLRRGPRYGRWLLGGAAGTALALTLALIFHRNSDPPPPTQVAASTQPNSPTESNPVPPTTQPSADKPKLQTWNLDDRATDADLEMFRNMPDLGVLRLNRCTITDKGLECIKTCKTIQHLELNHTPVRDSGLVHLHGLTELRHLGLSGVKITDAGLRQLKDMKQLRHLNLDFTRIGDEGLVHIAGLTNLTDLRLTQTKITDAGLAKLKGLVNLKKLDLYGTAIGDDGFEYLIGLPHLREMGLSGTKVSVAAQRRFQESRK